jgi:hypothetical protein
MASVIDRLQLPELPDGFTAESETGDEGAAEGRSLFGKIADGIKAVFMDNKPSATEINNQTIMREDFVSVNQTLNVQGLECSEDGHVTLTVEQVQALNDRIASLQGEVNTRQKTIDSQTAQIEALKKADGGVTIQVREKSKKAGQRVSAQTMFNQVKDLI